MKREPSDLKAEQTEDPRPVSGLAIVNLVLRHRRLILLTTVPLFLFTAVRSLASEFTYTSEASFIPTAQRSASNITGLAAQLGTGGGVGDAAQSPTFYAELMESRRILNEVAAEPYVVKSGEGERAAALSAWFGAGPPSHPLASERVLSALRTAISVNPSASTGIVQLRVTTTDPDMSRVLAQRVLAAVTEFNAEQRRLRAEADRLFAESQLEAAYTRLLTAENQLQAFLTTNREYRLSPRLTFDYERLARAVSMRQEIYNAVARSYEQAKVEAMRESPTISILEAPSTPVRPNGRGTTRRSVMAIFLGLLLGVTLALIREYFTRSHSTFPSAAEEFQDLKRATLAEMRNPLRLFQRQRFKSRQV